MTKLEKYARQLGIKSPTATATPIDTEAGKAGYEKYLADSKNGTLLLSNVMLPDAYQSALNQQPKGLFGSIADYLKGVLNTDENVFPSQSNTPSVSKNTSGRFNFKEDQELNNLKQEAGYAKPREDWTDEERWAFGEKYATDRSAAFEFAEELNNAKDLKKRLRKEEALAERTKDRKLRASLDSMALNYIGGFSDLLRNTSEYISTGEIDPEKRNNLGLTERANVIQGSIAQELNDKYGTIEGNGVFGGKGWGDVYGLGMSIGQSVAAGATGVVGMASMFGMAASNATNDAIERGVSSDRAMAIGVVAGAAEMALEKVSFKKLLGIASKEGVQNVFKTVLKQAGQEAWEEGATSAINEVADRILAADRSNYQLTVNALMAQGMSQAEAEKEAGRQVLNGIIYDTIAGAASGGISAGGAIGVNQVRQRVFSGEANAKAKELYAPIQNDLIAEGKQHKTSEKVATKMENKLAKGKELSGYDLRTLAYETENAARTDDVETTRKAIVERMKAEGLEEGKAKRLGEIALNKAIGHEVSKLQEVQLKNNEVATKVYKQISKEGMENGDANSDWARNTPIEELREELEDFNAKNDENALQSSAKNDTIESTKINGGNLNGNQEAVYLRDSRKWNGSENTEGQVSRMESSSGQTESREETARVADREAARIVNEGREIKASDLGIEGGSTEQTIRVVDRSKETSAMKNARKEAEARGLNVKFFAGDNLYITDEEGKKISARAYIKGKDVYVRADHPLYTSEQLMRHELGHDKIAKGEVDINAVRSTLVENVGKENIDRVADLYNEAYAGTGMTAEAIWEECICDSLGEMNIFASDEMAGELFDKILPKIRKAAKTTKSPTQTRGSPEGKVSREIKRKTKIRNKVKYLPTTKVGVANMEYINRQLINLYRGVSDGIADGIAIENGNVVYIVDSGRENGRIDFGVRKTLTISNDVVRTDYVRRTNNEAVSKGNISDGLSSKFGDRYDNNRRSNLRRESGTELQTDTGKSADKQGRILGEDADQRGLTKGKASRELDTKSSYAPTFYSHMSRVIDGIKTTKMGANDVVPYLKGKGVKDEEIKWSGVETFLEGKKSVTKAELQEFLAGNQLEIEEKHITGDKLKEFSDYMEGIIGERFEEWYENIGDFSRRDFAESLGVYVHEGFITEAQGNDLLERLDQITSEDMPKWSQWKLDGGTNYRELVFRMPNSAYSNDAMRTHWKELAYGVLAHARIQDMTTSDGRKMLFVEEIQSDWHNAGNKSGYVDLSKKVTLNNTTVKHEKGRYRLYRGDTELYANISDEALKTRFPNGITEEQIHQGLVDKHNGDLSKAGGVDDAPFRNNYHEYVLKRLLRMAAEEGYDSIGWTTADMQSERWSDEYAEGYRIEYDQDIPKFLRKYGKKWGAKVEHSVLEDLTSGTYVYKDKATGNLYTPEEVFQKAKQIVEAEHDVDVDVSDIEIGITGAVYVETYKDTYIPMEVDVIAMGTIVWSMDIPDSMKDSVLHEGQPKFSRELDAQYLSAVKRGDMETAQRMVDEAASAAGYTIKAYHGTNALFNVFESELLGSKNFMASSAYKGFFAAKSRATAENYTGLNNSDVVSAMLNSDAKAKMEEIKAKHNFDKANAEYERAKEKFFDKYKDAHGYKEAVTDIIDRFRELFPDADEKKFDNLIRSFEYDWNSQDSGNGIDNVNRMNSEFKETEAAKKFEEINKQIYQEWEQEEIKRRGYVPNIKDLYLKIENPLVHDFKNEGRDVDFTDLIDEAKEKRHDGCIFKNVQDGADFDDIYVVFNNTQLKSSDPVTYDDDGNVIPLSERFNAENKDIRFSSRTKAPAPYVSPTANAIVMDIDSEYDSDFPDKVFTASVSTQIAFTNTAAGIERIGKKFGVDNIESLVQAARVASHQAEEMIGGNQYRIGSAEKTYLGEGLQKIIQPIEEKGKETKQAFFDYLFHYHNADRMSLERRSVEWLEEKKTDHQKYMQRFKELQKEQLDLNKEKTALSRRKEDSPKRQSINNRLAEIKREFTAVTKLIRKLQKEIDSFTPLKNKPVNGLNHNKIEARKAEISKRIEELIAERKSLGRSKLTLEKRKAISQEIADLISERKSLSAEVDEAKSKEIIAEYEKNYDYFKDVAEKIWNYNKNINQYRVDTGLIDQETFDYLQKLYPHYVPAYHVGSKTGIAAVKGKNNLAVNQSIKRAKGSTKDLLNPIVIMARQTMETVRAGRVNQIARALYDGAGSDKTYLAEISKKKVNKAEMVDLDPMELRPKDNQVTFFKDGEKITLQVSKEIFAGFDAFTPTFDIKNPLLRGTKAVMDGFKALVTSYNPTFIIRNMIRDLQDAAINSKYPLTFLKNYGIAAAQITSDGEMWRLYRAMGGSNVDVFDFDKGFKAMQNKRGLEANAKDSDAGWLKQGLQFAQSVALKMKNANAYVEALPRLAEFISSIQAGNTAEQAMLDAADVTTNFARSGKVTKALNTYAIPFLNAQVQGFSKSARNVTSSIHKKDLKRSIKEFSILAAKAIVVGIIPFALNSLLYRDDEDYEKLREEDKENYYLFKVGNKFLKLPRGRMASVLAGAYNRTENMISGEEKAWEGYLKNASNQMSPVQGMSRTIFSPFTDVKNNVTWYGSAIEGKQFENVAPAQRYDESTSSIAIAMAKFLNKFGIEASPKKIHYLLDQYSGVVGDFVLPATSKKAEKGFISGNFTIDPVTSNKLSDSFYDLYYEAQYAKNADEDDDVAKYQVKHLNRVKSSISEMYDEIAKIQSSDKSDKEKLAEVKTIQILINEMYKTAIEDYPLITNAINATKSVDDNYRYVEVVRMVYGAEAALEEWNKDTYAKSKVLNKAGVSYDAFYQYFFSTRGIESDKDKLGNTISGSKRKKVIAEIDKLKISKDKKLLLIAISGYALSEADQQKLCKYLNSLKISNSEKKELAEMCGLTYKNGKITPKS